MLPVLLLTKVKVLFRKMYLMSMVPSFRFVLFWLPRWIQFSTDIYSHSTVLGEGERRVTSVESRKRTETPIKENPVRVFFYGEGKPLWIIGSGLRLVVRNVGPRSYLLNPSFLSPLPVPIVSVPNQVGVGKPWPTMYRVSMIKSVNGVSPNRRQNPDTTQLVT